MAQIRELIDGHCYSCEKETKWAISHRYIDYHGITHCFQCLKCGKVVPDFSWRYYQQNGKIMIPV